MTYSVLKADTSEELARRLNGIVLGKTNLIAGRDMGPNPSAAPNNMYKHPVSGLTLELSTPAVTVTFSGDLTARQIVDEINAAAGSTVGHLYKVGPNGQMVLALWDDAIPVALDSTGTANAYFGFSVTPGDSTLVQSPVTRTNIVSISVENLSRQYVALIHTP
jgi:hypothetical protein